MISEKDAKRFWNKVNILSDDECWEWQISCATNGYGQFSSVVNHKKMMFKAHRLAYQLTNPYEDISLLCICHKCDNKKCVNPSHLFSGSQLDNVKDCINKSRRSILTGSRGEAHPRAKLNESKVKDILYLFKNTSITKKELAKIYNVDSKTIRDIIKGITWKCINK